MSKSTLTPSQPSRDRREFLRLAGLLVGGAAAVVMPDRALAAPADEKASPKPENILGPEAALRRLMAGNRRYVEGVARRHDFVHEREALTRGQNPYAGLLSCADSRIAPEYAFDSGRGDLFVVRVAGNFVTADGLASLEYGVAVLQTPLLMVLGHGSCGAVDAGIKSVKNGTRFPGRSSASPTRWLRRCARRSISRATRSRTRSGKTSWTTWRGSGRIHRSSAMRLPRAN